MPSPKTRRQSFWLRLPYRLSAVMWNGDQAVLGFFWPHLSQSLTLLKSLFKRSAFYIHQENNMSLRTTTTSSFILEAEVTACWPSAQIPNCQCLFSKFVLPAGQYFISRLFQTLPGFSQLNKMCQAQAFLNFPFTSVQWSILSATPASLFSRSILASSFILLFFLEWSLNLFTFFHTITFRHLLY